MDTCSTLHLSVHLVPISDSYSYDNYFLPAVHELCDSIDGSADYWSNQIWNTKSEKNNTRLGKFIPNVAPNTAVIFIIKPAWVSQPQTRFVWKQTIEL